jgi:hypothetical protein
MRTKLTFRYDREADILHIDKRPPYAEQESEELPTVGAMLYPPAETPAPESILIGDLLLHPA